MSQENNASIQEMDKSLVYNLKDEFEFAPDELERQKKFEDVLRKMVPKIGEDESKIILAEVLIALKIEGLVGKEINEKEAKLVRILHESIICEPEKKRKALKLAFRLIA